MIQATVEEVRNAFSVFSRMFEETKLDRKASWRVARMLGRLKAVVKDFDMLQRKLYKDAGGVLDGRTAHIPPLTRGKDESDEAWEKRVAAQQEKITQLSEDIQEQLSVTVEIDCDPIPLSMLPTERKGDNGEKETIEYRAVDFMGAGLFLVDE